MTAQGFCQFLVFFGGFLVLAGGYGSYRYGNIAEKQMMSDFDAKFEEVIKEVKAVPQKQEKLKILRDAQSEMRKKDGKYYSSRQIRATTYGRRNKPR